MVKILGLLFVNNKRCEAKIIRLLLVIYIHNVLLCNSLFIYREECKNMLFVCNKINDTCKFVILLLVLFCLIIYMAKRQHL